MGFGALKHPQDFSLSLSLCLSVSFRILSTLRNGCARLERCRPVAAGLPDTGQDVRSRLPRMVTEVRMLRKGRRGQPSSLLIGLVQFQQNGLKTYAAISLLNTRIEIMR